MRQKRAKTYKKLMSLYSLSFGFRQPYQVLVDADMCRLAIAAKLDLPQQLSVVLQGAAKLMITQCCIHQLYLQGSSQQAAVDLAKSFERRKCNHMEAILGDECIASVIGKHFVFRDSNKHRYVVATQSRTLRVRLRLIPAVPIVHINRAVMILEPPSDVTLKVKQENEEKTFQPTATELATIKTTTPIEPPRKRRRPKGPNPLSVKKKVLRPVSVSDGDNSFTGQKAMSSELQRDTEGEAVRRRKRRRKHANTSLITSDVVSS